MSATSMFVSRVLDVIPRHESRRRRASMERAFERVKPGEQPPPPPPELLRWARETTYGVCAGIVYGAGSAHYAETRLRKPDPTESATRRKHRLWTRTISDTTLHGMRLGSFVSVFSATRLALEGRRGESDMWNTVGAGVITSALTGMAIPGNVVMRLKGAALGVAVGGLATLPFAYAVEELEKFLPAQATTTEESARVEDRKLDMTSVFIEQLESELEEYKSEEKKRRRRWFSRR